MSPRKSWGRTSSTTQRRGSRLTRTHRSRLRGDTRRMRTAGEWAATGCIVAPVSCGRAPKGCRQVQASCKQAPARCRRERARTRTAQVDRTRSWRSSPAGTGCCSGPDIEAFAPAGTETVASRSRSPFAGRAARRGWGGWGAGSPARGMSALHEDTICAKLT